MSPLDIEILVELLSLPTLLLLGKFFPLFVRSLGSVMQLSDHQFLRIWFLFFLLLFMVSFSRYQLFAGHLLLSALVFGVCALAFLFLCSCFALRWMWDEVSFEQKEKKKGKIFPLFLTRVVFPCIAPNPHKEIKF